MADEKGDIQADVTLIEEAQKYLAGDKQYSKSLDKVYRRAFDSIQDLLNDFFKMEDLDVAKLETVLGKSKDLVKFVVESYKASDTPPFEAIKADLKKAILSKLSGKEENKSEKASDTPKETPKEEKSTKPKKIKDPARSDDWTAEARDRDITTDPLPKELANHPEPLLPLILKAKEEYSQGNLQDAVFTLFAKSMGFVRKVTNRYLHNYTPNDEGRPTEKGTTKIPGADSKMDLEFEAFEEYLSALKNYEPYYNGSTKRWSTVLTTYLETEFQNRYKTNLTQYKNPTVKTYNELTQVEEITRGSGDVDHVSKDTGKARKDEDGKEIPGGEKPKTRYITEVLALSTGEDTYTSGTDFEIDSPDGIKWLEGGKSPAKGTKYTIEYKFSKTKVTTAPSTSLSDPHGSGSSRDEDKESNTILNSIRSTIEEQPEWQYEYEVINKKVIKRIKELAGEGTERAEKMLYLYNILWDGGFSSETRSDAMRELHIGDTVLTDWLKKIIYPAVLEALEMRSKALPPGQPVRDEELQSLRLKRRKLKPNEDAPKSEDVVDPDADEIVLDEEEAVAEEKE